MNGISYLNFITMSTTINKDKQDLSFQKHYKQVVKTSSHYTKQGHNAGYEGEIKRLTTIIHNTFNEIPGFPSFEIKAIPSPLTHKDIQKESMNKFIEDLKIFSKNPKKLLAGVYRIEFPATEPVKIVRKFGKKTTKNEIAYKNKPTFEKLIKNFLDK